MNVIGSINIPMNRLKNNLTDSINTISLIVYNKCMGSLKDYIDESICDEVLQMIIGDVGDIIWDKSYEG